MAGILEQPTPHEAEDVEAAEAPRPAEPKAPKKRAVSRVSSKRPGVTGRTFYLPDDLFILIRSKAIKRRETVSEFMAWLVESHFGVAATRKRKGAEAPGEGDADAA